MTDLVAIRRKLRAELDDMDRTSVLLTLSRADAKLLLHILELAEDMRLQPLRGEA